MLLLICVTSSRLATALFGAMRIASLSRRRRLPAVGPLNDDRSIRAPCRTRRRLLDAARGRIRRARRRARLFCRRRCPGAVGPLNHDRSIARASRAASAGLLRTDSGGTASRVCYRALASRGGRAPAIWPLDRDRSVGWKPSRADNWLLVRLLRRRLVSGSAGSWWRWILRRHWPSSGRVRRSSLETRQFFVRRIECLLCASQLVLRAVQFLL
jgi:hypothetical protein